MSGNLLVRFDEGRVGRTHVSPSLLLYSLRVCSPALKAQNPPTRYPFFADHGCGKIPIDPARLRSPQAGEDES